MALLDWFASGELSEEVLAKLLPGLGCGVHDASIAADAAGLDRFDDYVEAAVRCARAVETDPSMLASSAHLLAVGTR
jgi:hypothetical protein